MLTIVIGLKPRFSAPNPAERLDQTRKAQTMETRTLLNGALVLIVIAVAALALGELAFNAGQHVRL